MASSRVMSMLLFRDQIAMRAMLMIVRKRGQKTLSQSGAVWT
jgi:hypothetical protein